MIEMEKGLLYCDLNPEKTCDNCNECDICDLDSNKSCDNCGKCIGLDGSDYSKVIIEGILDNEDEVEEYTLENNNLNSKTDIEVEIFNEYDYIEDIPELRDEYEKKVALILSGDDIDTECSHNEEDECDCGHTHS
jgi:hypothetical protein